MKIKNISDRIIGMVLAFLICFVGLPVFHSPITVNAAEQDEYNLLLNGSFENNLTSWSGSGTGFLVTDATTAGLTANDGTKILKADLSSGTRWANKSQTATLQTNTDYLFSMWVYQPDSASNLILKLGIPGEQTNHTIFCPNKEEYKVWQKHTTKGQWFKVDLTFNSGTNTNFLMYIVISGGITYVDNISLKKIVKVNATAQGGTVSGLPLTIAQGDRITLTAVPDAGYGFDGWYIGSQRISTSPCYSFNAVSNTNLKANFIVTHNLIADYSFEGTSLNSNWNNSANRGGISSAEKSNGNQSLYISAMSGYQAIYYWPIAVEPNSKYRITMKVKIPSGASIPIIKVLDNGGSGNSILDQKDSGGNTWLNAKNNKIVAGCDWQDAYFTFNSGNLTNVSLVLTGNSTAQAYIDELYITKYFNISVSAETGGTVSGFSDSWAYVDTPIELTAQAEIGYKFDGWYEGDIKLSADTQLKFNANEDRNIVARFTELESYIDDNGFELENLNPNWNDYWKRASISTDEAYEGKHSLHFGKTTLTNYPYLEYRFTVNPNTDYMVKMMVNVPREASVPILQVVNNSNVHLINGRDKNNNYYINGGKKFVLGTGWFPVTATFNSGDNTAVILRLTGNANAEAYIDNLIVNQFFTANIAVGENGSVKQSSVSDLKYSTVSLVAKPDAGYMVEGWYINGKKVSEKKQYEHLLTENVQVELKFTASTLPAMTDFNLAELWCNDTDNLLDDGSFEEGTGLWNTTSFIKKDVLDVVELDGEKVLYFNPDGDGRQVVYFPVTLDANTEYMFSAEVRGKLYSETNHLDMSFGIMDRHGEYLTLDNSISGSYYNETPNVTTLKSITPPSWDNNWHRRGITFKTYSDTEIWIAISGYLSEAYLDDLILCEKTNAITKTLQMNTAIVTNRSVPFEKAGCSDSNNLVENYDFSEDSIGWDDGYGWRGMFSGICVAESGLGNKSLIMHSTTDYPDYHYYIKWIDVEPNTEYTLSLAATTTSEEASFGLLVKDNYRYIKLATWSTAGNRRWEYRAVSFNSNENTRIGIFLMNGGRVTALDDIRLFETSNATAITDKLSGKADIPEEVINSASNRLINGSFEETFKGWSTSYTNDFAIVNAKDETPTHAADGEKILKISSTGEWHGINQNLLLEANREYTVSFWYYRVDSGYMSLKFGNNAADNGWVSEDWLNNDVKNKWVYKKWTVNTTEDTALKLFLCAFEGTVYIDDVRVTATEDFGNLILNGNMSSRGMALNNWSIGGSNRFVYEGDIDGYTEKGVAKISGDGNSNTKYKMTYSLNVKANTDYVFRFYAKNISDTQKMYYNILNSSSTSLIGGDKYTEGSSAEWGKNELRFNSGNNTTVKIQFIENANGITYIDDVYFGEAINVTTNSSNKKFGSVFSDKQYVGEDDAAKFSVTTTQGGELAGWSLNESDVLISGNSFTYRDFEDVMITAVFKAKVGNLNEDESINILDLAVLRDILLMSKEFNQLGDLNGNNIVDAVDVVALKKQIAYLN